MALLARLTAFQKAGGLLGAFVLRGQSEGVTKGANNLTYNKCTSVRLEARWLEIDQGQRQL